MQFALISQGSNIFFWNSSYIDKLSSRDNFQINRLDSICSKVANNRFYVYQISCAIWYSEWVLSIFMEHLTAQIWTKPIVQTIFFRSSYLRPFSIFFKIYFKLLGTWIRCDINKVHAIFIIVCIRIGNIYGSPSYMCTF